jgi:hypothetical protein
MSKLSPFKRGPALLWYWPQGGVEAFAVARSSSSSLLSFRGLKVQTHHVQLNHPLFLCCFARRAGVWDLLCRMAVPPKQGGGFRMHEGVIVHLASHLATAATASS